MRALVTGATGFMGQHLLALLRDEGLDPWTLGRMPGGKKHLQIADVSSTEELMQALASCSPDYIFHLAGATRCESPMEFYRGNVLFTSALLAAVERSLTGKARVLLVGSAAEYGEVSQDRMPIDEECETHPVSHYGISKLAQTKLGLAAARRGLHVVLTRPFNVIGPGMPPYLALQDFSLQIAQIVQGHADPILRTGNLDRWRDFLDVYQTVRIFWDLIRNADAAGQVVNVCSGEAVRVSELVQYLIRIAGQEIRVQCEAARCRQNDIIKSWGSTRRLEQVLGRKPEPAGPEVFEQILEHCMGNC